MNPVQGKRAIVTTLITVGGAVALAGFLLSDPRIADWASANRLLFAGGVSVVALPGLLYAGVQLGLSLRRPRLQPVVNGYKLAEVPELGTIAQEVVDHGELLGEGAYGFVFALDHDKEHVVKFVRPRTREEGQVGSSRSLQASSISHKSSARCPALCGSLPLRPTKHQGA